MDQQVVKRRWEMSAAQHWDACCQYWDVHPGLMVGQVPCWVLAVFDQVQDRLVEDDEDPREALWNEVKMDHDDGHCSDQEVHDLEEGDHLAHAVAPLVIDLPVDALYVLGHPFQEAVDGASCSDLWDRWKGHDPVEALFEDR